MKLLEGFELLHDDYVLHVPLAAQRVLAFVALHERSLLRVYVAGRLWPGGTDQQAGTSLRSALWRLNDDSHEIVDATRTHLALARAVEVDARRQLATALKVLSRSAEGSPGIPVELVAGDLLPDWYDDWLQPERERLRQLRLHALERIATDLADARRFGEAVEAALEAVRADPLRESAHRTLVKTYLAEGNRHDALRHYAEYCELTDRRFGSTPRWRVEDLCTDGDF